MRPLNITLEWFGLLQSQILLEISILFQSHNCDFSEKGPRKCFRKDHSENNTQCNVMLKVSSM